MFKDLVKIKYITKKKKIIKIKAKYDDTNFQIPSFILIKKQNLLKFCINTYCT